MTEGEREKLLAKIRALFEKTTERGCTEAEAMTAAAKARELVEQYQIDLGAEELKREGFIQKSIRLEPITFFFARRILWGIDAYCEVKTWEASFSPTWKTIEILGLKSDVELAVYLIESLTTFALAGADRYVAIEKELRRGFGRPFNARTTRFGYLNGCAVRIDARLQEMAAERKSRVAKPGSYGALVKLDKPSLIDAEMVRLGIELCSGGGSLAGPSDFHAAEAGGRHGAKASFGRPVRGRVAGLIERKG